MLNRDNCPKIDIHYKVFTSYRDSVARNLCELGHTYTYRTGLNYSRHKIVSFRFISPVVERPELLKFFTRNTVANKPEVAWNDDEVFGWLKSADA